MNIFSDSPPKLTNELVFKATDNILQALKLDLSTFSKQAAKASKEWRPCQIFISSSLSKLYRICCKSSKLQNHNKKISTFKKSFSPLKLRVPAPYIPLHQGFLKNSFAVFPFPQFQFAKSIQQRKKIRYWKTDPWIIIKKNGKYGDEPEDIALSE